MISIRRLLLGTVGTTATVLAAVAVVGPDLLLALDPLADVVSNLARQDLRTLLLATSLGVGLYVVWAARSGNSGRPGAGHGDGGDGDGNDDPGDARFAAALARPPESVTADERTLAGAQLAGAFDRTIAGDRDTLTTVQARLRSLAVTRIERVAAITPDEARERVGAGTWTDDRTAAAFLARSEGPRPSLVSRIRLWLAPEAERERRLRATVRALRSLGGDQS